jgi:ATP-dependent helicase/nuclease subunit A
VAEALAEEVEEAWAAAAAEAARPRLVPRGVASEAQRAAERAEGEVGPVAPDRRGRLGPTFGEAVHRAIGLALRDPSLSPGAAAGRAARQVGLSDHLAEAADDVGRALAALEREGLRRLPGEALRLEYPLAAAGAGGTLLSGYADLVALRGDELAVVDFKTDAPPAGDVAASHPAYVEQVRSYGWMLVELGLAPAGGVRCGLLFTGDGGMRWV